MNSRDTTITLAKLVKGAKSRITETPQKIEMPKMPGFTDLMNNQRE